MKGIILSKLNIKNKYLNFTIDMNQEVLNYQPGQWFLFNFDNDIYRSYSVVSRHNNVYEFLVSLSNGPGNKILQSKNVGDYLTVEGIYGDFLLRSHHHQFFVATGSGISAISSLVNHALTLPSNKITLLWGSHYDQACYHSNFQAITTKSKDFNYWLCTGSDSRVLTASQEFKILNNIYSGRVNEKLDEAYNNNQLNGDVGLYVCGNDMLVYNTYDQYKDKLANIYIESFI